MKETIFPAKPPECTCSPNDYHPAEDCPIHLSAKKLKEEYGIDIYAPSKMDVGGLSFCGERIKWSDID